MRLQRIGSSGPSSRLVLFVTGLLLILSLAGCNAIDPSTGSGANSTPVVNSGTSNTDTSTPTATVTSASTPTTASTPGTTPTPTSPAIVPFRITGANAINPGNYSGACSATKTITVTGTIYAPANTTGGTVTYEWVHSDNTISAQHTVTFASGVTAMTVIDSWVLKAAQGNGTTRFDALKTLAPEVWNSVHATFSFTCKRDVAGVSASVTPASGCATVAKIFVFSATITISPSPSTSSVTVTYAWKRSNGASSPSYTVIIPAGQTTVSVTPDGWALSAKGTYTDKVVTSSPNKVTSNAPKITCQ